METVRETERDSEEDSEGDSEGDRERDREGDRERERQIDRPTDRNIYGGGLTVSLTVWQKRGGWSDRPDRSRERSSRV